MINKSLSYAYAEGGPVGVSYGDTASPTVQFTEEQLKQMEEANARRTAAEASIADSEAKRAALHAANPHIDFSESGVAAMVDEAQAYLNSEEGKAIAARMAAGEQFGTGPVTEAPAPGPDPVFDFPERGMPEIPFDPAPGPDPIIGFPEIPFDPAPGPVNPAPIPPTFSEIVGIGENAGQSDYQDFIAQNPQQTATEHSTYTPPGFQGVGSFLTPPQGSTLMYSTPGSVFKRPEGG